MIIVFQSSLFFFRNIVFVTARLSRYLYVLTQSVLHRVSIVISGSNYYMTLYASDNLLKGHLKSSYDEAIKWIPYIFIFKSLMDHFLKCAHPYNWDILVGARSHCSPFLTSLEGAMSCFQSLES